MTLDGLEQVLRGKSEWFRRQHNINFVRYADYFIIFLSEQRKGWRFTDPNTGASLIKIGEMVKRQRHIKIKAVANPFDPEWDEYFQNRDKKQVQAVTAGLIAKVHRVQDGICPVCGQVIQYDEELVLHHRYGKPRNFKLANLVFYHPKCHQQMYYNEAR